MRNVNDYDKIDIKTESQTLTDSYADLGSEINVRGYNTLKLYLGIDINDSENVHIKALGKLLQDATEEYELDTQTVSSGVTQVDKQYFEVNYDADGYQTIQIDVTGCYVIQLQAKAGTVGQTAGKITSAYGILVNT